MQDGILDSWRRCDGFRWVQSCPIIHVHDEDLKRESFPDVLHQVRFYLSGPDKAEQ